MELDGMKRVLMTKEVALTKLCCMTSDGCVGPECMAWRWADNVAGSMEPDRGYCGLAGNRVDVQNPDLAD